MPWRTPPLLSSRFKLNGVPRVSQVDQMAAFLTAAFSRNDCVMCRKTVLSLGNG